MFHSPASSLRSPRTVRPERLHSVSLAVLALSLLGVTAAHAQDATAQAPAQSATPAPAKPADQAAPAQAPPPAEGQASDPAANGDNPVVVTAQKPAVQNKIDRKVYDTKQDPQAATGSAGDILNNVPSVTVDADGTVALRGNTNVQVYVNGKPSAQMSGDNRAATLQSMAADDIDSVEVMTNPSSAFGSDSGGGIINIVMKKNRKLPPTLNVNVMAGTEGRGGLGLNGSVTQGKFTFSGGMNARRWVMKRESESDRIRNPGQPSEELSTRDTVNSNVVDNLSLRGQVDYTLTDYSNLTAEMNASRREMSGYSAENTRVLDNSGNVTRETARIGDNSGPQRDASITLGYDWRGKDIEGEVFKMQFRHSDSNRENITEYLSIEHQPTPGTQAYAIRRNTDTTVDAFSGDWTRPLANNAQVMAGWDVQRTADETYNYQSLFHTVGANEYPDPTRTNQFNFTRTVSAGYVTYQKLLGKWGVLTGLRVESVHDDINQVTSNIQKTKDYVNWSPSLFVTYDLSEKSKLKGTYSHKFNRPQAGALNPFLVYRDAQNVSSGNTDLQPEQVDNFELAYEMTTKELNYSATAYFRNTTDSATFASTYLPSQPDVLLTTTVNSGSKKDSGFEYSIGGSATKKLSYNISGNLGYSEQDTIDNITLLPVRRAGQTSSIKGRFSYKATPTDTYVVSLRGQGKAPTSQGYRTGYATMDMSYSKTITPKLRLVVNASDIFNSNTSRTITDTSIIHSETENRSMGRTVFVGLNYTFGAVRQGRGNGEFRMRDGGGGGRPDGGGGGFGGGGGGFGG